MSAAAAIATIAVCKLIEEGTHEELIAKQGKYYVLWEMQQGNIVKEHVDKHAKNEEIPSNDIDVISYTYFIIWPDYC